MALKYSIAELFGMASLALSGLVMTTVDSHAASCSTVSGLSIIPVSSKSPAASIYTINAEPQFTVAASGPITVSATDFWGRPVSTGTLKQANASSWTVTLPAQSGTGYFELRVAAASGAMGCLSWAVVPGASLDSRFGINTQVGFGNPSGIDGFVREAGIGAVRDSLAWTAMVTAQGAAPTVPASFDAYMSALAQDKIAPLLTLAFGNPAFEPSGSGTWTLPYGYSAGSQTDVAAFAQYAGDLAQRYGTLEAGRLSLAVWNEVDGTFCQGPACASQQTEAAAYAELVDATSAAAHEIGSTSVPIVGGATYGITLPWFESLLNTGAPNTCPVTMPPSTPSTNAIAGSVQSLDIHWYGRPEDLANNLIDLETLSTKCTGAAKPVVATEFGTSDWRDAADGYAQAIAENANDLVKQAAIMTSYGVSSMYWYVLNDRTITVAGDPENILWSNDNSHFAPNPAYAAYANFIADMRSMTPTLNRKRAPVGNMAPDNRTRVFPFTNGGGTKQLYIAWSVPEFLNADLRGLDAEPVTFVAPTQTTVSDVMGNLIGSYPAGSTVSLSLTASPIYITTAGGTAPAFLSTDIPLLASSFDDFGLTYPQAGTVEPVQPSGNWSYGYMIEPSGDAGAVVPGTQAGFIMAQSWLDGYWGNTSKFYFSVSAAGQEPVVAWSGNTRMSMWAVRRWTCPSTGPACNVLISGQATLSSTSGAGTRLLIVASDTVQYEGDMIPNAASTQPAVSIETAAGTGTPVAVTVAPGAPIDFAVTTGPLSNGTIVDQDDATGLYVWITANPG